MHLHHCFNGICSACGHGRVRGLVCLAMLGNIAPARGLEAGGNIAQHFWSPVVEPDSTCVLNRGAFFIVIGSSSQSKPNRRCLEAIFHSLGPLCWWHANGMCRFGKRCHWRHVVSRQERAYRNFSSKAALTLTVCCEWSFLRVVREGHVQIWKKMLVAACCISAPICLDYFGFWSSEMPCSILMVLYLVIPFNSIELSLKSLEFFFVWALCIGRHCLEAILHIVGARAPEFKQLIFCLKPIYSCKQLKPIYSCK